MVQVIKVRVAGAGDVDAVFAFIGHLEERAFDFENFRERYESNCRDSAIVYLVAVNEFDEAVGFVSCHGQSVLHHEGKVFEIQELYVARNHRGCGVGRMLFDALGERLEKMDCESLEVAANVKRSDAKKFYLKMGFVQTHVKFVKTISK